MSVREMQVIYTTDGSMPDAWSTSVSIMRHAVEWLDLNWSYGEPGHFAYWMGDGAAPDWLRGVIIYHVFIDRFATTGGARFHDVPSLAGFHGSSIQRIRERLGYLRDLEVTCLWLSPLFPSPIHHGYDAKIMSR